MPTMDELRAKHEWQFTRCTDAWAPNGWMHLVERAVLRLEELAEAGRVDRSAFSWLQIKEKLATLRMYYTQGPEGRHVSRTRQTVAGFRFSSGRQSEIWDLVNGLEDESATTCEACGRPGTQSQIRHFYVVLCEKHWQLARSDREALNREMYGDGH